MPEFFVTSTCIPEDCKPVVAGIYLTKEAQEAAFAEMMREEWQNNGEQDGDGHLLPLPSDAHKAHEIMADIGDMWGEYELTSHHIDIPAAPSVAIDWQAIARDLAGALSSCSDQIGQMRGMFDDGDGAIAEAVEAADEASEAYTTACAASPDTPSSPLRLTAVVAGGCLVEITTDDPVLRGIAYTVVDFDCEGVERLGTVVRKDGSTESVVIGFSEIEETGFQSITPASA